MKELKISISDELYGELSNIPDRDSFLAELIENELKATTLVDSASEINDSVNADEDLPEDAYFELEDTFEEEVQDPKLNSDAVSSSSSSSSSSSDEGGNAPFEKMAYFESIIFDLTERICDLEKQIIDMDSNIQFLKGRASLSDIGDSKAVGDNVSAEQSGSISKGGSEGSVPYATLSFPELKMPSELLDDLEDSSAGSGDEGAVDTLVETSSSDVSEIDIEEYPFLIQSSKPLLFEAEALASAPQSPEVEEQPVPAANSEIHVPDEIAPAADKLESCIFAYLPSGAEVKKDVIKSLLSKRYADPEVESKIDQLLSDGKISDIVKDDRVYLMRVPEKESA